MIKSLPLLAVRDLISDEEEGMSLIASLGSEHETVARIVLAAGADPNAVAEDCGLTALKIAAMSGDAEFARVLFTGKIELTKETRSRRSKVHASYGVSR